MKWIIFCMGLLVFSNLQAQKFVTSNGTIEFSGEKPFEKVRGKNNEVESSIDSSTGEVEFHALIKSFHFKIDKMEEDFNKKFMESDIYPESEFKGRIKNISSIDFNKKGNYPVIVEGQLTIHNVTKLMEHPGQLSVSAKGISAESKFKLNIEDFNMEAPTLLGVKMATEIIVLVEMNYVRKGDQ